MHSFFVSTQKNSISTNVKLRLTHDLVFQDLYSDAGLTKISQHFTDFLDELDPELCARWQFAKTNPDALSTKEESALIIALAPFVEEFIAYLFNITPALTDLKKSHNELSLIPFIKRQFVQRFALKKYDLSVTKPSFVYSSDLDFATRVNDWLQTPEAHVDELDQAARFAAFAALNDTGKQRYAHSVLFKIPRPLDYQSLLQHTQQDDRGLSNETLRPRIGFDATDEGVTRDFAIEQSKYCIHCHHQGKDSCSKGLKARAPETGVQKNPLNIDLLGCPLEEKISEMNQLKNEGIPLGALAVAMIDNPLLAATGHRICNDCTKACIFQKQEPVAIPAIETQTLNDILDLPWGFEIYSLLSRWNPLNIRRPLPKAQTNKRILIVGMGPAGFNLAHHLLNDGHTVVGIDGLKIEPLPSYQNGITATGDKTDFEPIYNWHDLREPLSSRITGGFGGVAEYGITVRWDKNYLKVIRMLLERRSQFLLKGGIRFGGTLSSERAFELGFDHIALCMGAGSPTLIPMKNALVPGVRQASDFLMGLQLTGAHKADSLANLQVRLPIVVIGGGLTAIDTATEATAYYPIQVKKFKKRYDALVAKNGVEQVRSNWTECDQKIADEMLAHAALFEAVNTPHEIQKIIQDLGGATLLYRGELTKAPSYRLNHEEIEKALEEGIFIKTNVVPKGINVDSFGHAESLNVEINGAQQSIPARTILIAAGTKPNINLTFDEPHPITPDFTFQALDENGEIVTPQKSAKPDAVHVLMEKRSDNRGMSFFGDLHPSFSGNVVKAMASAKRGYPIITRLLKSVESTSRPNFLCELNRLLTAKVHAVNRLTPTIVEIVLEAPLAAEAFKPGQFYRLQNFETYAPYHHGTRFAMEGLALTGAWVDREKGLIATIVLEMGGSSNLCAHLKAGEPVVLMGPTGAATDIPKDETVLLIGGGLGNAVLFSIGKAMRDNGCRVLYVAGYKKEIDRFKVAEIEAAADAVIWCCDEANAFQEIRPTDVSFHGNPIDALAAYAAGKLGNIEIPLAEISRMLVIGSDTLMAAVARARHEKLKDILNPKHIALGSINSPMQCMMKEICAQCLQVHKDPITGVETVVYSCANQDQLLDHVDFNHLRGRLNQNSVQEKLTKHWLDYCLSKNDTVSSQY
jgi:NADPH-dependent glutamate synthase beta subunit-like oxidoreductase/NAD(P)H-flavin reductase